MERSETTLFMLMSVDGKISTGDIDTMDVDKDFLNVEGVKDGLKQYYDIEQTTDAFSFNSGRVFKKIGVNEKKVFQNGVPVSFVIVDNKPHLTAEGVKYLAEKTKGVFVVSTNADHPAKVLSGQNDKITFLSYDNEIDFQDAFHKLKVSGANKLTIQSGGTLNSVLLRAGLIDHLSIIVAPVLIGGKNTSTLIDGDSLHSSSELMKLRPLTLVSCEQLEHSYLHLKYDVKN